MKTFLSLDIGNTHPNIAVFEDGQITQTSLLQNFHDFASYPQGLACVVGALDKETQKKMQNYLRLPPIADHQFLDMPVHYAQSLGQDRLVCAYKIFQEHQGISAIIDAGTFVTVDIVDESGFRGGYILPGPQVLAQSYQRGAQLPRLEMATSLNLDELPHTTDEAIVAGMQLLYRDFFSSFFATQKPQQVFLTGGQAQVVEKLIQYKGHLVHTPHLVHESLYLIGQKLL